LLTCDGLENRGSCVGQWGWGRYRDRGWSGDGDGVYGDRDGDGDNILKGVGMGMIAKY